VLAPLPLPPPPETGSQCATEDVGGALVQVKVVSVMPCVAKKDEATREENRDPETGVLDVDYVLTTRELAKLIETARPRIHSASLPEEEYDNPLGE